MSEEQTKDLNGNSTNPLPLEELLKRHFDVVMARFDRVEVEVKTQSVELKAELRAEMQTQLAELKTELRAELQTQLAELKAEMQSQTALVGAELRTMNATLARVDERMTDLDYKVDSFVREQIAMKRDMFKLQEAAGLKPGLSRV